MDGRTRKHSMLAALISITVALPIALSGKTLPTIPRVDLCEFIN